MSVVRIIFSIIIMLSILGGTNYYVARRIYQWIHVFIPQLNTIVFVSIYIFISFVMILGFMHSFFSLPTAVKNTLSWISACGMGIFAALLVLFIISDLLLFLGTIVRIIPKPLPNNIRFISGLMVALLTTGIMSYGMYNASQVKHVSYELQIKDTFLDDLKIVMISDSHLGAANHFERNLEHIVQEINQLKPDIVCLSGDVFNDDFNSIRDPAKAVEQLQQINATYGVYACYGNHDGGSTMDDMNLFLEQSNINLLNDEYIIIEDQLVLLGRLDGTPIGGFGYLERKETEDVLASIDYKLPIIVLDHNPSNIEQYGSEVDLILSGHTHRGQVFPGNLITKAMFIVDYGHYQKDTDSPHVIVSSGVSTWGPPMRIGTNNEIVSIVLR